MTDSDPMLFWLEQVPIEESDGLFLPADTPVHNLSGRTIWLQNKQREERRRQTLARIRSYFIEQLQESQQITAKIVDRRKLPSKELRFKPEMTCIDGEEFLIDSTQQIIESLKTVNNAKQNELTLTLNPKRQRQLEEEDSTEKLSYLKFLTDFSKDQYKTAEMRCTKMLEQIIKEDGESVTSATVNNINNTMITTSSSISVATLPPLPRNVSRVDPRTTLFGMIS